MSGRHQLTDEERRRGAYAAAEAKRARREQAERLTMSLPKPETATETRALVWWPWRRRAS